MDDRELNFYIDFTSEENANKSLIAIKKLLCQEYKNPIEKLDECISSTGTHIEGSLTGLEYEAYDITYQLQRLLRELDSTMIFQGKISSNQELNYKTYTEYISDDIKSYFDDISMYLYSELKYHDGHIYLWNHFMSEPGNDKMSIEEKWKNVLLHFDALLKEGAWIFEVESFSLKYIRDNEWNKISELVLVNFFCECICKGYDLNPKQKDLVVKKLNKKKEHFSSICKSHPYLKSFMIQEGLIEDDNEECIRTISVTEANKFFDISYAKGAVRLKIKDEQKNSPIIMVPGIVKDKSVIKVDLSNVNPENTIIDMDLYTFRNIQENEQQKVIESYNHHLDYEWSESQRKEFGGN